MEGDDTILRSWTWELRYARSSIQTLADRHTTTYLCINFPPKLSKRISDTIHSLEALAKNPLFMDTLIIDEMIAFYRDAIKSHRSQLLAIVCPFPKFLLASGLTVADPYSLRMMTTPQEQNCPSSSKS